MAVLHRLIAISDVFLTNKPPNVRQRLRITEEEVRPAQREHRVCGRHRMGPQGAGGQSGRLRHDLVLGAVGGGHGHLVYRR